MVWFGLVVWLIVWCTDVVVLLSYMEEKPTSNVPIHRSFRRLVGLLVVYWSGSATFLYRGEVHFKYGRYIEASGGWLVY